MRAVELVCVTVEHDRRDAEFEELPGRTPKDSCAILGNELRTEVLVDGNDCINDVEKTEDVDRGMFEGDENNTELQVTTGIIASDWAVEDDTQDEVVEGPVKEKENEDGEAI